MTKFKVGKSYEWYQKEYGCIKVIRRTPRTITVTNGNGNWKMLIFHDENMDEYVVDMSVPKSWRDAFTCSANWIKED